MGLFNVLQYLINQVVPEETWHQAIFNKSLQDMEWASNTTVHFILKLDQSPIFLRNLTFRQFVSIDKYKCTFKQTDISFYLSVLMIKSSHNVVISYSSIREI